MPTPPKPAKVIKMEKKSHRTKRELAQREKAENGLLTGKKIKENPDVKKNEMAHKEFQRVRKLLEGIGKNDDLYGAIINRYCLLSAECVEFEQKREYIYKQMQEMELYKDEFVKSENVKAYYSTLINMQKNLVSLDRQVQVKRRMMLEIEKENVMTIAASLRSIPKKAEKKSNPLREALANGS